MREDLERWWFERLTPPPLEVGPPLFRRRSKVYSAKRKSISVPIPTELASALEQACGEQPARWVHVLLAGIASVLYRYGEHERIAIGTPPPRESSAAEETSDAVVIVLDVTAEMPFADLVAAAGTASDESYPRSAWPLAKTVEAMGLDDVQNRHPLFTVALRVPSFHDAMPNLRQDVTVELTETDGQRALEIDYSARLYDPATIERFGRHVLRFLASSLADDTRPIHAADYLDPEERQLLLEEWSGGAVGSEDPRCLHQLFEEQAARTPDWEALSFKDEALSYSEVNRRANRVANYLRDRGAGEGQQVGLCVSASEGLLIGMLGVLKTGAAVVPIVPTFPTARNALTIRDAELEWIVTESALENLLPDDCQRLCLDTQFEELKTQSEDNPESGVKPENLVYVLFTSGSTGRPKGVCLEHRSLVNLVLWQRERGEDPAGQRTLQRTSIGFDVSFQEIFSTWAFGGSLVIATEEVRDDVSLLPSFLHQNRIARAFLPPVALHQLAASAATQPHSLDCLREIIVAGEQLQISLPVIRFFREIDCTLDNHYGPTETHVVTAYRLEGPSTRWPELPPIGKPIHNTRLYVLDRWGQPVPPGIPGEVCIGGLPVARGYIRQDEGLAEAFDEDPFTDEGPRRLYRTGDIGRFLADGNVEFLGRRDHQVKIRGYRIELGEVEAIMRQVPGIRQAVASVHEDEIRGRQLIAHVVTDGLDQPDASTIRDFMLERLPGHMVPSPAATVRLESLPLTPTGKLDRKSLPVPELKRSAGPELGGNRSETEQQIAAIWGKVLGFESIGLDENFMDLGGHSLLGIQIVSQINDLYNVRLPLRSLLRGTTIAQLSAEVESLAKGGDESAAAESEPSEARQEHLELPNGRKILVTHKPEAAYLYVDVFEQRTYDRAGIQYPQEGCVFDVGANIGLFTLYALGKSPGLQVFAFEPAPPLFEALERNTEDFDQVQRFQMALSDRNDQAELTYYPTLTGMTSLFPSKEEERALLSTILRNLADRGQDDLQELIASYSAEYVEERLASTTFPCELSTLSKVLAETGVPTIDLLKIDVQKAELDILHGIDDSDWPKIRQLAVEVHDLEGRLDGVAGLLRDKGYQVTVDQDPLHRDTVVHFVYAV